MENFAAYDVHMVRRELLGQNKSVLLKSPAVLELVCEDLEVNNAYDELLYAAQKGNFSKSGGNYWVITRSVLITN